MDAFPELLFSLTVQCTILLLAARFLVSRQTSHEEMDSLWSSCHAAILLLCVLGVSFPHLRLWTEEFYYASASAVAFGSWPRVLFVVWVSGVIVLSTGIVASLIRTTLLVRNSVLLDPDIRPWIAPEVPLNVRLLQSSRISTPFCWQLHKPLIILPTSVLTFPHNELQAIIRHEYAHLQAGHPLRLFLQRLVEVVFWFHPLVWTFSRHAALERELVSDQIAANNREAALSLLRGLWRVASNGTKPTVDLPAGLSFGAGGEMLNRRVDVLVENAGRPCDNSNHSTLSARGIFVAAAVAAMIWLPLNPHATSRSWFSPWPSGSALFLQELGLPVRDYEVDARLLQDKQQELQETSHD
jgi:Zn-dependent protease with chaperone function